MASALEGSVLSERPTGLTRLLDAAHAAYKEFALDPNSKKSVERIFSAIANRRGKANPSGVKLPVCAYLPTAVASAKRRNSLQELLDAFVAFEPQLGWRRRATYDIATASDNFHDGHGNCMIIGPGGFEDRSDLGLGVSLLAPNVRYPDHDHPPEETYLVMTDGMFRQGDGNWFAPGVGGSFYNVPMIKHAMRSGDKPLLAFWALWSS